MELSADLSTLQKRIEDYARGFGLDFFPIHYEMLDYRMMNQMAAYDGFPTRYPHWRFGMEYERLSKSYAYGLHRIYEMVINTDPCYAYLLVSNQLVDQKLVMAHVCGHSDFFKNNLWFAHTNRRMLDEMANHGGRVRRHIERQGLEKVESFLDACLSLENLIDIHQAAIRRRPEPMPEGEVRPPDFKMRAKGYMDSFINPPDYLAKKQRQWEAAEEEHRHFPPEPERDILLFLLENAPLESWQHDLLDIVREEAYYFAPQRQTKIMNEGWAVFAHTHIMTGYALEPEELIDYADHHSGTVAVSRGHLNPYKLGYELFRDIEDRWNRGAFGPEYEACQDARLRREWNQNLGLGREKVFEVLRIYNDLGFIDEFLTEEFARQNNLFGYDYNPRSDQYEISTRDFQEIKRRLLFQLTNFGSPVIDIIDANHENRGELYMLHRYEGVDLDVPWAQDTLKALYTIWGRPVYIQTIIDEDQRMLYGHGTDGPIEEELTHEKIG